MVQYIPRHICFFTVLTQYSSCVYIPLKPSLVDFSKYTAKTPQTYDVHKSPNTPPAPQHHITVFLNFLWGCFPLDSSKRRLMICLELGPDHVLGLLDVFFTLTRLCGVHFPCLPFPFRSIRPLTAEPSGSAAAPLAWSFMLRCNCVPQWRPKCSVCLHRSEVRLWSGFGSNCTPSTSRAKREKNNTVCIHFGGVPRVHGASILVRTFLLVSCTLVCNPVSICAFG